MVVVVVVLLLSVKLMLTSPLEFIILDRCVFGRGRVESLYGSSCVIRFERRAKTYNSK